MTTLWTYDISDIKTFEVHLLVGSDLLWHFHIKGDKNEPAAIETKLGYVLSDNLKGIAENKADGNLWIIERNDIKDSLDKLWDLEAKECRTRWCTQRIDSYYSIQLAYY